MRNQFIRPVAAVIAVVIGSFFLQYPGSTRAAELGCGELAGRLKAGDDYQLKLEVQSQSIRIEFGGDFCSEPAKNWFGRALILPVPAQRKTVLPPSALQAPPSEILVTAKPGRRSVAGGNDALPLPGQQMRQSGLPDLGFGTSEREIAPLPIRRTGKKPTIEEIAATEAATAATSPPEGLPVSETPSSPSVSRVNISENPEGGEAKFTKFNATAPESGGTSVPGGNSQNGSAQVGSAEGGSPTSKSKEPEPEEKHVCDRELTDYWQAGEHLIDGQKVYLSGVFTLDLDNDDRVDNVGFKIGAPGKIGNVLNYFAVTQGRLSAGTIDTLKLDYDQDLHRLCPGNITFKKMSKLEKSKAIESAKRRQQEAATASRKIDDKPVPEKDFAKEKQAEEDLENKIAEANTEDFMLWVMVIASVFFVFGGIGIFFVIRSMRSADDDDEYDDDEYDEDDDEDEEKR